MAREGGHARVVAQPLGQRGAGGRRRWHGAAAAATDAAKNLTGAAKDAEQAVKDETKK